MTKPNFWLWAGMVGGLMLTLTAVFRPDHVRTVSESEAASGPVAARVNGRAIARTELDRVVATLREKDPQINLTTSQKQEILDQLIGEELLVQRAVQLGLAQKDPMSRRLLLQSMIESVGGSEPESEPSESDLKAYYKKRRALFAREGRVRIEHIFVRVEGADDASARDRALSAAKDWKAGLNRNDVQPRWGDAPLAPVPAGFLPLEKLREYLGPTVARTAAETPVGTVTEPIRALGGYHVLKVLEKEPAAIPPFEDVRGAVARAFQEEMKARRVQAYVKELRAGAEVAIAPEAE